MKDEKNIIYQTPEGHIDIIVSIKDDTIWLDQYQLAELFQTDRTSISKHIKNIYKSGELIEEATCAKIAQVQIEGNRKITRNITQYNLDAIISVGYRVNSKRGTQFRVWANNILKDYLDKGYALNEKRLQEKTQQLEALKQTVRLLNNVAESRPLTSDEAGGLLKVLTDYAYALEVLDKYDHRSLTIEAIHKQSSFIATYEEAMKAIQGLRNKFGGTPCLATRKMNLSKVLSAPFINHLTMPTSTQA